MQTAKIDLHLHLDGSLNLEWAWKTAVKRGVVAADCTFEQYYDRMHQKNFKTREEGFKKFDFPIAILQTEEDLHDGTLHLIETLEEKGLIYAEIRFAPQQHTLGGLTQAEVVAAVLSGIQDAKETCPGISIGLLNCLMHKGSGAAVNHAANLETVEVTRQFLHQGVVGLDLAGFENNGPFLAYADLFEKAREYQIPYTIHAGEMGEGIHVAEAIQMGAWRIGHGINCVQDPEWLQMVVDKQIPLEVCVTSNVKDERNYAAHPIRQLLAAGAAVTVNTDNMTFSRTDLANEHSQLRAIGVTTQELKQCTWNALNAAFCDEATKEKLRKQLEKEYADR